VNDRDEMTEGQRRAAVRAQMRENEWNHPQRMDLDETAPEADEFGEVHQACPDPYCRYCKDITGEVRHGFVL